MLWGLFRNHHSDQRVMPSLPALDTKTYANHSPHVVILGAGANLAALPHGDARGMRLPLMRDLIGLLQLQPLLKKARVPLSPDEGFEELYDRIASAGRFDGVRRELEDRVKSYFADLELPERVTLYDEILATLRNKDLIATFNWDPFLLQAYARNRDLQELPRIVFLHGNVYLGYCERDRVKGYSTQVCSKCGHPLKPSPLLYPIRNKAYREHPLLAAEWNELEAALEHAYMLTIFGYSAPVSDLAAREILLKAWSGNETRELAEIEIVDILPRRTLAGKWHDFIVRQHYGTRRRICRSWQYSFPRRSCEALAWATLQLDPWAPRALPRFRRLDRLKEWIRPLVEEETALQSAGTPFRPFRPASAHVT